jgi:hypothetical protein
MVQFEANKTKVSLRADFGEIQRPSPKSLTDLTSNVC